MFGITQHCYPVNRIILSLGPMRHDKGFPMAKSRTISVSTYIVEVKGYSQQNPWIYTKR